MTAEGEKPLGLDMPPDEAFARFLGTKPEELPDRFRPKKKRGPPKRPQVVDREPSRADVTDPD